MNSRMATFQRQFFSPHLVSVLSLLLFFTACDKATETQTRTQAASSPPPSADCDRLAADPDDPQKKGPGVAVNDLDLEKAIEACVSAVEAQPENIRVRFQLGRILLAADHTSEAMPFLQEAADKNYPAALAHVGLLQNTEEAAQAYLQRAASQNYKPAADALAEIKAAEKRVLAEAPTDKGTLSGSSSPAATPAIAPVGIEWMAKYDFSDPTIIKGLYQGDFKLLRSSADKALLHIYEMNEELGGYCPRLYDHDIASLARTRVMFGADGRRLERGMEEHALGYAKALKEKDPGAFVGNIISPLARQERAMSQGRRNAAILAEELGCTHPIIAKIYGNMKFFARNPDVKGSNVGMKATVMPLNWGSTAGIFDVPLTHRDRINSQVVTLIQQEQKIIRCVYGPFNTEKNTGFQTYDFWYQRPPDNIQALIAAAPAGTHPLRVLGFGAVESCPETLELAAQTRRSGMAP